MVEFLFVEFSTVASDSFVVVSFVASVVLADPAAVAEVTDSSVETSTIGIGPRM